MDCHANANAFAHNDEKYCHIEVSQETEISKRILHSLHFLSYLSAASEISFLQCKLSYLRAFNPKVSQKSTHPLYPPPQGRGNSQNYHLQRGGGIKKQTPIVLMEEVKSGNST